MSQSEIEALEQQQKALEDSIKKLQDQAAAINSAKLEILKRIESDQKIAALKVEQEKSVVVTVIDFIKSKDPQVNLRDSIYRTDLVEIYRLVPTRRYIGSGMNEMRLKAFIEVCEPRLKGLPNVTVEYGPGIAEQIEWFNNAPDWTVRIAPTQSDIIEVMEGPKNNSWSIANDIRKIAGCNYDYKNSTSSIPAKEGWRVWEILKDVVGVIWDENANAMILAQVEKRVKLDKIAKSEDCSPEFLAEMKIRLSRIVFNPQKQIHEPLWQMMLPFQRIALEFAVATNGRMLLGDGTGLGKTIIALAYAEWMRYENPRFQTICALKAANIANWRREIKNITGIEDPVECYTSSPDGISVAQVVLSRAPYVMISCDTLGARYKGEEVQNEFGELETDLYPWAQIFNTSKPDLLIVDEAHQVKNNGTHRWKGVRALIHTPHILSLSASFILNRTPEFWTNLHLNDPEAWKSYDKFKDVYTWDGKTPKNVKEFHELLRPVFLRRQKKDVQKDLPPINRMQEHRDPSERAKMLCDKIRNGIYQSIAEFDVNGVGGAEMNIMSILAKFTRFKQVCAIDSTEYTADLATGLIDEWNGENEGSKEALNPPKVLIFSHFKGSAYNIAQRLGHQAVCTVRKTSSDFVSLSAEERDELFESARRNPHVRFIVTTEAAKEGHNLEFCDWVIFNDLFWTPAAHDQCEGRAYGRLANPHTIDSYYIVVNEEIVKFLMAILAEKLAIIEEAMDGVETSRTDSLSIGREILAKLRKEMNARRAA